MTTTRAWFAALSGAAVALVASVVPFSPLLGGAVTGYVQADSWGDGLQTGALAGAMALVPLAIAYAVVGSVLLTYPDPPFHGNRAFLYFLLGLGAILLLLYTVALSAAGGVVGSFLRAEYGGRWE